MRPRLTLLPLSFPSVKTISALRGRSGCAQTAYRCGGSRYEIREQAVQRCARQTQGLLGVEVQGRREILEVETYEAEADVKQAGRRQGVVII